MTQTTDRPPDPGHRRARVVVVGGGISGLAAAWELSRAEPALDVVVLESTSTVGGKLRLGEVAGHRVDVGSESVLARRPELAALAAEAGLADGIVHPTGVSASIWTRGRHWSFPAGSLMGVPGDPAATAGILDPTEVDRAQHERVGPPLETDVSVGEFVEGRLGTAVVDRLVEPLLAGVYAGHARRLSLQAALPALWPAANEGLSITQVARDAAGAGTAVASRGPVFAGYRGGLGELAQRLSSALLVRGVEIRTSTTVRELVRTPRGWALTSGPTTRPERVEADGVVLALPATPAARLLHATARAAAEVLASTEYASVAIVTLALPRSAAPLLAGSGFLVPPVEGVRTKAATYSSTKWAWVDELDPAVVLLRASVGRAGEAVVLQRSDDELVELAVGDLRRIVSPALPTSVDAHVQRWGGGLPQYAVGHLDRMARVREAVAALPGLAVAGAAYDGVGIPACIASGRAAAVAVLSALPTRVREVEPRLRG
ncbi:protoporphyrinogen oxidase [Lapillicoccus sp.]|uniref:protoporphyrinogen oxidase n=1 Tax=Lapillicoccus sp. TaxID=1909287 RepID=UPI003266FDC6